MRFASSAKIVLMATVPSVPRVKSEAMRKRKVVPPLQAGRLKEVQVTGPFVELIMWLEQPGSL